MSYSEQLKHPNWQRVRLEVLNAAGWACFGCGAKDETLHVHHKRYIKGHMAWDYPLANFEALCEECHESRHIFRERLNMLLADQSGDRIPEVIGLLSGWFSTPLEFEFAVEDSGAEAVGFLAQTAWGGCMEYDLVEPLAFALLDKQFVAELRALIAKHTNLPSS